ncbi:MAG: GatB/YqeY domain-containing protein [Candidatus Omnitrophica bacterium]|nr:GatB/YqeY domain-containing protein [Candidatus Omnitrophota bacterium]
MSLQDRINEDLKLSIKARDEIKTSTLRMLKAASSNAAIQKGKDVLEDGEMMEVIQKLIKQRQESVEAFTKAGRTDMAQKESKEADILKGYLPAAMSEAELKAIIEAAIKEVGASGPAAVGQVMKAVLPKVKGRADGKQVNQLVSQLLQK